MSLKETYNKIASLWHQDHKKDDWWIEGTNKYITFLKKGDTILDVGCGPGTKTKYLSERGFKMTGIDFSENLIEIAKEEVPESEFYVMDISEVGKLGVVYDGVLARASLLHVPKSEIRNIIRILVDVLKTEGYLYIAVKGKRAGGPEEEVVKEDDYGFEYERFFSYYTLDEIENYLKELNMEVVYKVDNLVGKTNWLQIISKKI